MAGPPWVWRLVLFTSLAPLVLGAAIPQGSAGGAYLYTNPACVGGAAASPQFTAGVCQWSFSQGRFLCSGGSCFTIPGSTNHYLVDCRNAGNTPGADPLTVSSYSTFDNYGHHYYGPLSVVFVYGAAGCTGNPTNVLYYPNNVCRSSSSFPGYQTAKFVCDVSASPTGPPPTPPGARTASATSAVTVTPSQTPTGTTTATYVAPSQTPAASTTATSSISSTSSLSASQTSSVTPSPTRTEAGTPLETTSSSWTPSITGSNSPTPSVTPSNSPSSSVAPVPFSGHDVAVLRVGSGEQALVPGVAQPLFIDSYSTTAGSLGLQHSLPVAGSHECTLSTGSNSTWLYDEEGLMSLSLDNAVLVFPCYDSPPGVPLDNTVLKVAGVARVDSSVSTDATAPLATAPLHEGAPQALRVVVSNGSSLWWGVSAGPSTDPGTSTAFAFSDSFSANTTSLICDATSPEYYCVGYYTTAWRGSMVLSPPLFGEDGNVLYFSDQGSATWYSGLFRLLATDGAQSSGSTIDSTSTTYATTSEGATSSENLDAASRGYHPYGAFRGFPRVTARFLLSYSPPSPPPFVPLPGFVFQDANTVWITETLNLTRNNFARSISTLVTHYCDGYCWYCGSTCSYSYTDWVRETPTAAMLLEPGTPIITMTGRVESCFTFILYLVSPTTLYQYNTATDSSVVLATAPTNTVFRGVAPAPFLSTPTFGPAVGSCSGSKTPSSTPTSTQSPSITPSSFSTPAPTSTAPPQWPKLGNNLANTGVTTFTGPASPPNPRWRFGSNGGIVASPVIGFDGTVYVGDTSGYFYAVNGTTGELFWQRNTGNVAGSAALVGAAVYVGTSGGNNKVWALDSRTGRVIWSHDAGGEVVSSPTISNNLLYYGDVSGENMITALNLNTGERVWNFTTGFHVYSAAAVSADGLTIYQGSQVRGEGGCAQPNMTPVALTSPYHPPYPLHRTISCTRWLPQPAHWFGRLMQAARCMQPPP